jgi:20S proteasome alpha/beta subunit
MFFILLKTNRNNRLEFHSNKLKIIKITKPNFKACAMSGLIADAKTLIDKARVEAQVYSSIIFCYFVF